VTEPTRVMHREVVEEPPPPPPPPRHSIWPWLLSALLAAAAIVAVIWALAQGRGPDTNEVPGVVGFTVDRASERVRANGFVVAVVRQPSQLPAGSVVREFPEGGADLERGSTVGLIVSAGRQEIAVPELIGLERPAATRLVRSLGLVEDVQVVASERPAGVVLDQTPAQGERVPRGSTVTLVVAKGPALVTVPAVVGLTRANAEAQLQTAGLTARVREVPSEKPVGTVVAQSPPPRQQVRRGSPVTLNVSKGPGTVAVPDVVGLQRAEASAAIRDAGLTAIVVTVPAQESEGTVVAQNPTSGSQVRGGSRVRLNVSEGPQGSSTTTG
jgi:eukaryotic-like serine/threonine-protein kinase